MGESERKLELNRSLSQLSNQFFGEYNCDCRDETVHKGPYVGLASACGEEKICDTFCTSKSFNIKQIPGYRKRKLKGSSIPRRCLICYVEVGGRTYKFRKHAQFTNTLDKFLDIIAAKKSNDEAKFATKNGKAPKLWVKIDDIPPMCSNCYSATKRLVSTFEQWEELTERIVELKSKIKSAIKLSTRIATENETFQSNLFILDHVREFILGGPSALLSAITEATEKETGGAVKLDHVPVVQVKSKQEARPISKTDEIFNAPERKSDESTTKEGHNLRTRKNLEFITECLSDTDNVSNSGDYYDDLDPEFIPEILEDCGNGEDEEHSNKAHEGVKNPILNVEDAKCSLQLTRGSQDVLQGENLQVTQNKITTASDACRKADETSIDGNTNSEITNELEQKLQGNLGKRTNSRRLYWQKLRALYPPNLTRRQIRALHSASLPARRVKQELLRQEMKPSKHAAMLARRRLKRQLAPKPTVAKDEKPKKPLSQTASALYHRNLKQMFPGKTNKEIRKLIYERKSKELKITDDGLPGRSAADRQNVLQFKNLYTWVDDNTVLFRNIKIRKLDNGTFECSMCSPSFNYRYLNSVGIHIRRRHIDLTNSYECEHCDRKYYYHNELLKHLRSRHRIGDRLQCHLCGMTFADPSGRHYHIKAVHEKNKPHKCEYCDKAFIARKDLTIHVRRHTGERPFVCHVCAATFVEKQSMKKHIRKLHPDAEEVGNTEERKIKIETTTLPPPAPFTQC